MLGAGGPSSCATQSGHVRPDSVQSASGGGREPAATLAGARLTLPPAEPPPRPQLGTANPLNNARATLEGMKSMRTFKQVRVHFVKRAV